MRQEYADVLRDEFGLDPPDDELDAIMDLRAQHGNSGASHPFFG